MLFLIFKKITAFIIIITQKVIHLISNTLDLMYREIQSYI